MSGLPKKRWFRRKVSVEHTAVYQVEKRIKNNSEKEGCYLESPVVSQQAGGW